MDLHGSTAVVTGASSGIGAATARAMARNGATVLLLARSADRLEAVAGEIADAGGEAVLYPVDLADGDAVSAVADEITEAHGIPDVILNVAGFGRWDPIEGTTPEEAAAMMAVPYLGAFRITQPFVEGMIERDSGHIVNLTSAAAYVPWPGSTAYAAARWAMRGFSEALEVDLHETGVGVSLVATTTVESPYWTHNPGSREKLPGIARLFRTLTPEDVAAAIVEAVEAERREVLLPTTFAIAARLASVVPGVFRWLVTTTGWRRPPADTWQW
jgi:short-subunit dehydrogenase